MNEVYRYTALRRSRSQPQDRVELPPAAHDVLLGAGDGPVWSLSRVPGHQFLRLLAATDAPPTDESVVHPLLEALGRRPRRDLEAQRAQLREALTDGRAVHRLEGALGAVTRLALAARPVPVADLVLLTRSVVALRTALEWAAGSRPDEDWRAGRERPLLRPDPATVREDRPAGRPSFADRMRGSLRRRRPRPVPSPEGPPAPAATAAARRSTAGPGRLWQGISGLATFAALPAAGTPAPQPDPPPPDPGPSLLQPVGSQDLIVIRTRHIGYRLAELSRIENIAPGETRDRKHRVETETSSTFFEEVENEEETTESLATTTRDELRTEITTLSAEQLALRGVVRSSYRGPVAVDVEASAEFGQQSEVRTNTAMTHAVDVVDEASTRVRERVLRRNEHRFRRLIAETNRHRFANEDDRGRVAQYYWLEKVQRVALFNYGRRMMYEFVVPEPASYLRELGTRAPADLSSVPAPPTEYYNEILAMTLEQLEDEYTSGRLTASFAVSVDERPAATWTDAEIFKEVPGEGDEQFGTGGTDLVVPAGYEGVHVRIAVQAGTEDKDIWTHLTLSFADLALHLQGRTLDDDMNLAQFGWRGEPRQDIDDGGLRVYIADAPIPAGRPPLVEGTYKARIFVENFNVYALTVGMLVLPTEATVEAYRRSILAAVVTDYRRQYETFTAQALAAAPGGAMLLENLSDAQSAELRTIEHDEVKRAALAVVRNADPVGADPIQADGTPDVAGWFRDNRPLADEILFLEQAFEWEHMNFVLYGYHWSDPEERALQVFGIRGGDRPFREFLKAGAARVQLPVRPGFAKFVDDYMMTGAVWSGGESPEIGSPGYVDFITEQSIQLGAPANEVPQTEEVANGQHRPVFWDVVTPTDLVMLKVWDDGDEPPLERMIPPDRDALTVPADTPCTDPLTDWQSGTGAVPDDPSA